MLATSHVIDFENDPVVRETWDVTTDQSNKNDVKESINVDKSILGPPMSHSGSHGFLHSVCQGDEIVGRCKERAQLMQSYKEMKTDEPNICVLISGPPGVGKKILAKSLQKTIQDDQGYYATVSFDPNNVITGPMVMMTALEQIIQIILDRGKQAIHAVRLAIERSADIDIAVLVDTVPALKRILGDNHGDVTLSCRVDHSNRKALVLRAFFEAIFSPATPTVLVLHNVHAADDCAINILRILLSSPKKCLFVVATFRQRTESIVTLTQALLLPTGPIIKDIELQDFDESDTKSMVSCFLGTTPAMCDPVSQFIFQYSKGSPPFIVELLRFAKHSGLIVCEQSSDHKTSYWNMDTYSVKSILQNLDGLSGILIERLKLESTGVQELLKVAACLGFALDEKLLSIALSAPVSHYVSIAVNRTLLVRDESGSNVMFANSNMQEAAYSLIPIDERQAVHLAIGRKIWRGLTENELPLHIPMILYQINLGIRLVTNPKEKYALASLHLQLAERSAKRSHFPVASVLLDSAIRLLGESHWRDQYELSLSIFNSTAEVEYTRGNFEKVQVHVDTIILNARCLDDKLQARTTKIYTLIALDKPQLATDMALKVLAQLGEKFPTRISKTRLQIEFMRTSRLLQGESDEKILRMPNMRDSRTAAAMQLMNMVFSSAYMINPMLGPLVCLRMVRLTLQHGLCSISSFAFAIYGMLLCSFKFDFKGGYRYGQLALKVLDRFGAKEWLPRVYAGVFGFIHGWVLPMKTALEPLLQSVQVALETGDIEFAGLNAHLHSFMMFDLGKPLQELKTHMMNITEQMRMLKQELLVNLNKPFLYMIEAFIGDTAARVDSYDTFREQKLFDSKHSTPEAWIHNQRCIVAYVFCDYEMAVSEGNLARRKLDHPYTNVDLAMGVFFHGLACLALSQKNGQNRRKLIRVAKRHISLLDRITIGAPEYCLGKLFLLRAELSAIRKKFDLARSQYISAIALSAKGSILMEEAVANERAGRFMQKLGDPRASDFLHEALAVFQKWGAESKVKRLREELGDPGKGSGSMMIFHAL
jgi:histidine kinase